MQPLAYYNEIDPYAARWLRSLIAAGHIAPGDVDERSIEDVRPNDLTGYRQCHFFAGVGVWSYALRRAGWPDDREIWTGSCPCQPFSTAGAGTGFADERHLWPAFFHLIRERRPARVTGEQVASKDADPWIDLVCADLGSLGYASGAIAFPAASVGAPHIRDRLYWAGIALGNAKRQGLAQRIGFAGVPGSSSGADPRQAIERTGIHAVRLADADGAERQARHFLAGSAGEGGERRVDAVFDGCDRGRPGAINGFWRDADWLACRDGKWRPVEPGTFPLANGAPARVGRLRAYGNAINAEAARVFIEAVMETL
jgi:DNA (cytosine-5)-methyltransferase 1